MKSEYRIIADIIQKNTRVLDVGCDEGILMEFLKENKSVDIRGLKFQKKSLNLYYKGLTL